MRQEQVLFIVFVGAFSSFILGYFFQNHLPPPKPTIVGIDLGTTFSCVGAFQAGTGERLVFRPDENKTTIPSIIAFTPEGVLVGRAARRQAETNPRNTLYDAKRFIGKTFTLEDAERIQDLYEFRLFLRENGTVNFAVEFARASAETASDAKKRSPGRDYGVPMSSIEGKLVRGQPSDQLILISPEEVGGIIIDHLRKVAEGELSTPMRPVKVRRAVLSVPADFRMAQRNATSWAAEIGGVEVMRIVSEPTAAALAYGVDKENGTSLVMVVDLGGGTLDISILRKKGGVFWVLGMAGDNRLGGQDFNRKLRAHLLDKIQKETGVRVTDPGDLQRLSEECERAKIELSTRKSVRIQFPFQISGGNRVVDLGLSRDEFSQVNGELFSRVLIPIDAALEMAELTTSDIDSVVLVGGSTRVPRVREMISEHFGGKELDTRVDPELAVTLGVSIQAGVIGGAWPLTVSAVELPMVDGAVRKIQVGADQVDDDDDGEDLYAGDEW